MIEDISALQCNGKHKGNESYLKAIHEWFNKEFYDNLLIFFINYNLLTFNVRDMPMTEAKQDIIDASKSPIDVWINDHYDSLVKGMICSRFFDVKTIRYEG